VKRLTIVGLAILLSLVLSLSTAISTSSQAVYTRYTVHYLQPDYSYYHWREMSSKGRPFPPVCTLPSVETGDTETGLFICKETGKTPTESEYIEWSSYSIWLDCYENNNRDACNDLTN
jgi:hypothetical protein